VRTICPLCVVRTSFERTFGCCAAQSIFMLVQERLACAWVAAGAVLILLICCGHLWG
jgi:hypothetical protein